MRAHTHTHTHVKTQGENKPRREASEETNPVDTWILDPAIQQQHEKRHFRCASVVLQDCLCGPNKLVHLSPPPGSLQGDPSARSTCPTHLLIQVIRANSFKVNSMQPL